MDKTLNQLNAKEQSLLVRLSDPHMIDNMLESYIAYLCKTKPPKYHPRILVLTRIRQKLMKALMENLEQGDIALSLTTEEGNTLKNAIASSGVILYSVLSPSKELDDVLECILVFCQKLTDMLSPYFNQ